MSITTRPAWQNAIITLTAVVTAAVFLTLLYVGRVVLIPIAMAIFFTYVLAPVVAYLQRRRLGHTASVILTVGAGVFLFLGTSFLITRELASLTETMAANSEAIKSKVETIRNSVAGSSDSPLSRLLDDLNKMIKTDAPADPARTVVLEPRESSWTPSLNTFAGPATEAFGQAAFSFILVVFMLLSKTDLADRLLRLLGERQLTVATHAMNDASQRISAYLFRQFVINFAFGLIVAAALFAFGLKYSLLWGVLIAIMRYVPYIGTWLGVIPPALFAFAMSPDWFLPLATLGTILGLELLVNNFVEPRLYGKSLGVSEVAFLVSAALWAFLWGPVGLILSGPITTCLLVLGRHAPPFWFLEVLLGTRPALSSAQSLFQRLAAKDQDEALRTLQKSLKDKGPDAVFDDVILPAYTQLKISRMAGQLDDDDNARILGIARELHEDLLEEIREAPKGDEAFVERVKLLACPAQDDYDRLALDALTARLPTAHWEIRISSVTTLTGELLSDAAAFDPQVIVIGSLPPGGVAHARYLMKRLRQRFPNAHLLIGRWHDAEFRDEDWKQTGADATATSVREALKHLAAWKPIFQHDSDPKVAVLQT